MVAQHQTYDQTRASLSASLGDNPEFVWARCVLIENTDSIIQTYLEGYPSDELPPSALSENLKILTRYLEQSLARQDVIHSIEEKCLGCVVEVKSAFEQISLENQINRYNISHIDSASNEIEPALEASSRLSAIRDERMRFKISQFSAPNGAMNFNERLDFLRNFHAESIRVIYQRADLVVSILKNLGWGVSLAPRWNDLGPRKLFNLAKWCRDIIRMIEDYFLSEFRTSIYIPTTIYSEYFTDMNGQALSSEQIKGMFTGERNFSDIIKCGFKLNIDLDLLESCGLYDAGQVRFISLSLGMIFGDDFSNTINYVDFANTPEDMRDKLVSRELNKREVFRSNLLKNRYTAYVRPPESNVIVNGITTNHTFGNIALIDSVAPTFDLENTYSIPITSQRISDISPVGTWEILWGNRINDSDSELPMKYIDFNGDRSSWAKFLGFNLKFDIGYAV